MLDDLYKRDDISLDQQLALRTAATRLTQEYDGVFGQETIERFEPRVAVVNAGGASFLEGGLIVMGVDDVREVAARVPTVVCVHLEALNHCFLTRAELAAAVPGAVIPRDGETVSV